MSGSPSRRLLYLSTPNLLMADLKPTMLLSIQHCFRIAVEPWESWSVALSTVAMKAVRAMFLVYQVRLALVLSTSTSSITATRLAAKKCLPQLGSELVLMMSRLA